MQYRKNLLVNLVLASLVALSFGMGPKKELKVNTVVVKKGEGYRLGAVIKNAEKKDGAEIITLFKNSEGEKIGLKKGDVIIKFDGTEIKEAKQLNDLIQTIKDGKKVDIAVLRDGNKKSFKAVIKKVEDDSAKVLNVNVDDVMGDKNIEVMILGENGAELDDEDKIVMVSPDNASKFMVWKSDNDKGGYLGVNVEELTQQLREYFEVKEGILVKEVLKDSPAEKAGLKAGDVIYKINEKKIEDYTDLVRTLNYYDPGDKVTVYYSRKGKTSKKKVELGEKKDQHAYTYKFDIDTDEDLGKLKEDINKTVSKTVIVNTGDGDRGSASTEEINVEFYII